MQDQPTDRWMCADECAKYFGLRPTKKGEPNRRGFLERIACRPSFPKPLMVGNEKKWSYNEVHAWALEERRVTQAA